MRCLNFQRRQRAQQATTAAQMTKREFVTQYLLNRALGNTGGLDARSAAGEAIRAWDSIIVKLEDTR